VGKVTEGPKEPGKYSLSQRYNQNEIEIGITR
jgi:hypothetical protein